MNADSCLSRTEALIGAEGVARLARATVAVIGVGGVGSWCAEALVRTGVGHLILLDDDVVCASNLNRQCEATQATVGRAKVEAMRERLLAIFPACDIVAERRRYGAEAPELPKADVLVDAIDSVDAKAELLLRATAAGVPIVSSLGAALRTDPTKVTVRRFDRVEGDGLARALRQRFKKLGRFPSAPFPCVCSTEPPVKSEIRGSLMTVTATFGMTLAAEALCAIMAGRKGN